MYHFPLNAQGEPSLQLFSNYVGPDFSPACLALGGTATLGCGAFAIGDASRRFARINSAGPYQLTWLPTADHVSDAELGAPNGIPQNSLIE